MKSLDSFCRKLLPAVVLVLGVVLLAEPPAPAGAGTTPKLSLARKFNLQVKKNLGPLVTMDQTLFKVNLPLTISKMPGPWKNAKFVGLATVYFLDGPGEAVGYAVSKSGEQGMPLNITLNNGSYSGTVSLPIQQAAGTLTAKTCSAAVVMAKLGSQIMYIGSSKGGTAPNSGVCGEMKLSDIPPGTIIHP